MGKHKHKISRAGKNTKINAVRRVERAKRQGKSENYINDLIKNMEKNTKEKEAITTKAPLSYHNW